jgi:hypothetical protein
MMEKNRERARRTGLTDVPIVLENHTKDILTFSDIARFAHDLATADDIKTVTLSEVSNLLRAGKFLVRSREGLGRISVPTVA